MDIVTFDVPAMYGDHHVVEVRRLLLALPGVEDVYASSAFHAVEISYDPAKMAPQTLRAALDRAGYMDDLSSPAETGIAVTEADRSETYFRHTAAFNQTGKTVGFSQDIAHTGRALWPCPGMGVVKAMEN